MNTLDKFMAYAADFEASYSDDDWSRILPHFSSEATYEIVGGSFACVLNGPEAIAAGFKKSLDGFDRRFDNREIEIVGDPSVDGDEFSADWKVHYTKSGVDPFTLCGRSTARIGDEGIVLLRDSYDAQMEKDLGEWRAKNDLEIDPSYT